MSANRKEQDSYYQDAKAEYNQIADQYSGQAGWDLAQENAEKSANWQSRQAAANAGAEANIAARTAGVSKARAANMASGAAAQAAGSAYTQAFNNAQNAALSNNNNTMTAAGQKLGTEQTEAQNRFSRRKNHIFSSLIS